jgi:hypothetical protein
MKATIDVPDAMYRQVKANAALRGRAVREVTIELYERWLAEIGESPEAPPAADAQLRPAAAEAWLAAWDAIGVEVATKVVDPRPASEIAIAERR